LLQVADLLLVIAWSIPGLGESARAVSLAERALKLNPHYPDWYNQGLSLVFFFGEQYDRSVKYRLLVKEPVALDYAFLAMAYAYLGRAADAQAAAANVMKLDHTWIAERYSARRAARKGGRIVCQWCAQGRTTRLRACRQAQGHAQSDPRQVLRRATRQDHWVSNLLSGWLA
jgi:predicted Zn-dependent protease